MESVRTGENWRESWWVTNTTNNTIAIGDLQLLPAILPGQRVDLLHHYTRERISHATTLLALIRSGRLRLNKQKSDPNSFPGVIDPTDAADAITPAEENEVALGGGTDHSHDNKDTLDGFDEDSSGLIWNGSPIEGGTDIHNDLLGLQGGDDIADEFYHLTYSEMDTLTAGPSSNADALHNHVYAPYYNIDGGWVDSTYYLMQIEGGFPGSTYGGIPLEGDGGGPGDFT